MNIRQGISIGLAFALLIPFAAGSAWATKISGRTATELEWYEDEDTAVPAYQYLLLNVLDIGGAGYNFRAYGRLADDLNNEVDVDSDLYYGYLEKKGFLLEDLDFRLGRQFIATAAGASIMDGLRLDYGFLDKHRFTLFGGGDVSYYEGYDEDDLIYGVELAGSFFDALDIGASYLQKQDAGNLSHELSGLNLDLDISDSFNLYSETQYDWLSERVSYFLGGATVIPAENWDVRLEYLYSLPVFSAYSIYSVFAVEEYQEVTGEVTYRFGNGLRAFGRYTREIYTEFADANVYELGVEKIRTGRFAGYLSGVYRDDTDGQDLQGVKLYGSYRFNQYVQVGLGADIDVFERQLNYFDEDSSPDETTSGRYWADATVYFTKALNLEGKVEYVDSEDYESYSRGRVRLNFLF
jgi:hypothetical protein